jgi:hypothetical protein
MSVLPSCMAVAHEVRSYGCSTGEASFRARERVRKTAAPQDGLQPTDTSRRTAPLG